MDAVTQALVEARAIIADPDKFAQGAMARDADGVRVSCFSPRAKCYCSWGALQVTAPGPSHGSGRELSIHDLALIRLGRAARRVLNANEIETTDIHFAVPVVNDHLGREAALQMYDFAIAEAA